MLKYVKCSNEACKRPSTDVYLRLNISEVEGICELRISDSEDSNSSNQMQRREDEVKYVNFSQLCAIDLYTTDTIDSIWHLKSRTEHIDDKQAVKKGEVSECRAQVPSIPNSECRLFLMNLLIDVCSAYART